MSDSSKALAGHRPSGLRALFALALLAGALAACLACAGPARAAEGEEAKPQAWWHLDVTPAPTNLAPQGEDVIDLIATNLGDTSIDGASEAVTITDQLPPATQVKALAMEGGLSRTEFQGLHGKTGFQEQEATRAVCPTEAQIKEKVEKQTPEERLTLSCTYKSLIAPFEAIAIGIKVKVEAPAETVATAPNEATVQGGGIPAVTEAKPLTISPAPVPFAATRFEMNPEAEGGGLTSQAGGHPFQFTNVLDFSLIREKATPSEFEEATPGVPALPRNLSFRLPPGLLGNPTATERCSEADFSATQNLRNLCPASTVIGVAVIHFNERTTFKDFFSNLKKSVWAVPVFNLEPAFGEPARFGFAFAHALVYIDTAVNGEEEYAATATVTNATQSAEVESSVVTLWGDPGDAIHDNVRGWGCVEGERRAENEYVEARNKFVEEGGKIEEFPAFEHCKTIEEEHHGERKHIPFLIFPTTCNKSIHTTLEGVSWPKPGAPGGIPISSLTAPLPTMSGCESLAFGPELADYSQGEPPSGGVKPDVGAVGSQPSGLSVAVHVPQTGTVSETGRATSAVKATTVKLPVGVLLNPGAADGLLACAPAEVGVKPGFESEPAVTTNEGFTFGPGIPECLLEEGPGSKKQAKVGTFTIRTPLLDHEIPGAVYLGSQDTGSERGEEERGETFKPPLVLYLLINDEKDGIRVKLAGSVTPDPITGQLTSTFANTPQLPFEDLKLHFFDEGRASVSTPGRCGTYATTSEFTPWAEGVASASPSTSFEINTGPGGASCAPPLPLTPSLQAGPPNPGGTTQAGAFSPFSVAITRPDGDEAISGLNVTLPTGVAGVLANVTPCPEPQAELGTCGPESLIGHATTESGLGPQPFTLRGGNVYLTVGYQGGPFGLSIVFSNIAAGPFRIGNVVVRSSIFVNEFTAQVTVKSTVPTFVETVPHVRKGIPVQLKQTRVETLGTLPNGKGFEFNPTNCSPLTASASFLGDEGGTGGASALMQFTGCDKLAFNPGFFAEVTGQGSKPNGVTFKVVTTSQGLGVGNIAKVFVALPIQLPSRLSTIQKACRDFQFEANQISGCSPESKIGEAKISTPVLKNPLSGPAYLVSHGNASFPDVEFVLQGQGSEAGIKLILDGKTDIKKGITYSRFESTPDAPFTRFETILPAGPHSALTANVPESKHFGLCGQKLLMPTEIYSQSGILIKQKTNIKITGCKPKKCNRACKLKAALKKCHKIKGRSAKARKKRHACERAARKRYGTTRKHKAHKKH